MIKIEIVDILFTITKTIQERRCLKYKPENGYSGKQIARYFIDNGRN